MIVNFKVLQPERFDDFRTEELIQVEVENLDELCEYFIENYNSWAVIIMNKNLSGYIGSELFIGDYDYSQFMREKTTILLCSINQNNDFDFLKETINEIFELISKK